MSERVKLRLDGREIEAAAGTALAAALMNAGLTRFRTAVGGGPRGPLCAMGTCFECRVTIDGVAQRRACLELARDGMEVTTGD